LENEEGGRVTPSHLHIDEKNTVVVGHYARRMSDLQPECAIYGNKFNITKLKLSPFQMFQNLNV
jgi:molecular chaperone DnaK (HSP70)